MSIGKFLLGLDSDQLQVAINAASELLKRKTAGEKIRVTIVSSSTGRKSFFDRDIAKAFFVEVAEKESECVRPELGVDCVIWCAGKVVFRSEPSE